MCVCHVVCDVHTSSYVVCGLWCVWGVVCVCMVCVVCGVCGVWYVCAWCVWCVFVVCVCVWSVCKATLARSHVIVCAFKVVPQYLSEESETRLFMCRLRVDGAWFPSQHIQLTARWWSHQDY